MTVFNLGSINVDQFYQVPHLPKPGETLPATAHRTGLGGKGANQSVAVAQAGSDVRHLGTIGRENRWVLDRLGDFGVDVSHIGTSEMPTGHAIIMVDDAGENSIITFAGANYDQSLARIETALSAAGAGDILMLQNEVSCKDEAVRIAREKGLFVAYSAAPFRADVAARLLPSVDLLVLNEIEAQQLSSAMGCEVAKIPVPNLIVTRGARGAVWIDTATGEGKAIDAFVVEPVDTTGAGDCFIGYVIAGLDQGLARNAALRLGAAAASIKVTRPGTADAIPSRAEVDAFLAGRET